MRPIVSKFELVWNALKRLDIPLLKKAVMEKAPACFRGNGRCRAFHRQMPIQDDDPGVSCKAVKPDLRKLGASVQGKMPALARELEGACKDVEPEFMRIGEQLQTAYGDAMELARQVRDSVDLIGGQEKNGVLSLMRRLAEASLGRLEGCRKDVSEKTSQIKRVQEQLDALFTIFFQVEKTGRLLSILAVNIGIESARSNESKELFSVVASDTAELSKKIKTVSRGGQDALKEALDTVRTLYGDISQGLEKITGMGQHAGGIVQEAVREIEALMASTLQVAEQANEHAGQVSRQVGDLVVGVQFHDSMSQRVAHITKALGDVEAFLIEDEGQKLPLALPVIRLQAAQIKEIIDEIGRVYETCVHSFEEIIKDFSTLLNHLRVLSANAEPDTGRERGVDSFERLRSSFDELDGVLRKGEVLMEPVRHAATRASDAATRVFGLVQDIHAIGFESHLMALNAIVKAAHLASGGAALEVLAQEVRRASGQSTAVMDKAEELLDRITGAANRLRDQYAAAETEVSLENSVAEMTRVHNRFIQASAAAHRRGNEIRADVSKAKADLDFLPLLAERFTGSLDRLEAMAMALTPFSSENRRLSQNEVDEILKRYTMDREREIHKASFSGSKDEPDSHGPAVREKEAEDKGDVDGFTDRPETEACEQWDNVELFDSDTGAEENRDSRDGAAEAEETSGDKRG